MKKDPQFPLFLLVAPLISSISLVWSQESYCCHYSGCLSSVRYL